MFRRQTSIQSYMSQHLPIYVFVSVLFVVGVIFGLLLDNALSLDQKSAIAQQFKQLFQHVQQMDTSVFAGTIHEVFFGQLKWIIFIWFIGLTVVGMPLVFIFDFIKGIFVGFTVGYLAGQYSWKGILFIFASIVPQNLLIIPALFICSAAAISFSLFLMKTRLNKRNQSITGIFIQYSSVMFISVGLVFTASLTEYYLSPLFIKWVVPLLA